MGLYKRGIEKASGASLKEENFVFEKKSVQNGSEGVQKVFLKTGIDKFYHVLELSSGSVSQAKILEILDVSSIQLEDWAKTLERQKLIDIDYTATGNVFYKLKTDGLQKKDGALEKTVPVGKKPIDPEQKKKLFLVLAILLFVSILVLAYFFYSTEVSAFFTFLQNKITDATGLGA